MPVLLISYSGGIQDNTKKGEWEVGIKIFNKVELLVKEVIISGFLILMET